MNELFGLFVVTVLAVMYYFAWKFSRTVKRKEGIFKEEEKPEKPEAIQVPLTEEHFTVNGQEITVRKSHKDDGEVVVDGFTGFHGEKVYYFPETRLEEETTPEHTIVVDEPTQEEQPEELEKITVDVRDYFAGKVKLEDYAKKKKVYEKPETKVVILPERKEEVDGEETPAEPENETVVWEGASLGDEKARRVKIPVTELQENSVYVYYKQNLKGVWHKGIIIADKSYEKDFKDPEQTVVRIKNAITTKREYRKNFIMYTRTENGTSFYLATKGEEKTLRERISDESK